MARAHRHKDRRAGRRGREKSPPAAADRAPRRAVAGRADGGGRGLGLPAAGRQHRHLRRRRPLRPPPLLGGARPERAGHRLRLALRREQFAGRRRRGGGPLRHRLPAPRLRRREARRGRLHPPGHPGGDPRLQAPGRQLDRAAPTGHVQRRVLRRRDPRGQPRLHPEHRREADRAAGRPHRRRRLPGLRRPHRGRRRGADMPPRRHPPGRPRPEPRHPGQARLPQGRPGGPGPGRAGLRTAAPRCRRRLRHRPDQTPAGLRRRPGQEGARGRADPHPPAAARRRRHPLPHRRPRPRLRRPPDLLRHVAEERRTGRHPFRHRPLAVRGGPCRRRPARGRRPVGRPPRRPAPRRAGVGRRQEQGQGRGRGRGGGRRGRDRGRRRQRDDRHGARRPRRRGAERARLHRDRDQHGGGAGRYGHRRPPRPRRPRGSRHHRPPLPRRETGRLPGPGRTRHGRARSTRTRPRPARRRSRPRPPARTPVPPPTTSAPT